jgi:uncharacterized protein
MTMENLSEILEKEFIAPSLTFVFKNYEGPSRHLLVSNISGAAVMVDNETLGLIESFREPKSPAQLGISSEDTLAKISKYYEACILIDADRDPYEMLSYRIERLRNRPELDIIPVVTTACNLACPYCFQPKGGKSFWDQTMVEKAVEYTLGRIENEEMTQLYVSLYGGEPLLNFEACSQFMEAVWNGSGNIRKMASLVTNGTLITEDILEELKKYNMNFVQITIDGSKEINDKRRVFKNGEGTYDLLMDKIEMTAGYLPLQIRVNVDRENISSLSKFIDDLLERGLGGRNIRFDLARVMANTSPNCWYESHCIPVEEFDKDMFPYFLRLKKEGFKILINWKNLPRYMFCAAYSGKHVAIDPDGNLYNCLEGIGLDRYITGNLFNDPIYNENYREWVEFSVLSFSKCRECSVVGFCGGGCGAEAMKKHDSLRVEPACVENKFSYIGGVVLPPEYRRLIEGV